MGKASKRPRKGQGGESGTAKQASANQILQMLSHSPTEVYQALGLEPNNANLSFPTDGSGARIRVSIRPHGTQTVPTRITLTVDDQQLEVPIEVDTDFQDFQPLQAQQARVSRSPRTPPGVRSRKG